MFRKTAIGKQSNAHIPLPGASHFPQQQCRDIGILDMLHDRRDNPGLYLGQVSDVFQSLLGVIHLQKPRNDLELVHEFVAVGPEGGDHVSSAVELLGPAHRLTLIPEDNGGSRSFPTFDQRDTICQHIGPGGRDIFPGQTQQRAAIFFQQHAV